MKPWLKLCVAVIGCFGAVSGCATLNPAPFQEYAKSVAAAQSALDKAISLNYNWVRSGFIENFQGRFSELVIQPGPGYEWTMRKAPLHLSLKQARAALVGLNNAYADYTSLLVRLAELEVGEPGEFDRLTRELNTNAQSALKAMKADASGENTTLFSAAAMEAARIYLRSKHLSDMEKVIRENQKQVEAYSGHCISLVHTLRSTLKTYYVDKYEPIKQRWEKSGDRERTKLTEEMMTLNEGFIDAMRLLQEIETLYTNLPKAHAELAKSVDAARWHANREGLDRLVESGQRLKNLYDELKPQEGK